MDILCCPYTIQNYLSGEIRIPRMATERPEFEEAENKVKERIE
jgi:succinate dehydrogenase / fumarate reductase flavoprotein subunit